MYPRKTQATMNQFNVFTVGKNTRNRQLIYFYLPPYSFCRLRVSCSRACCPRTGPFKTFSIFLFAILTVSIAFAPCPRANGAKRRSGRKPGARVTNLALAIGEVESQHLR